MKSRIALVLAAFFLGLGSVLKAQDYGWRIDVRPTQMGVWGGDIHFADIYKYQAGLNPSGVYWFNYGVSYAPIILTNRTKLGWQYGLSYRAKGSAWTFGMRGLYFDTQNEMTGHVTSSPNGDYIAGVRMWDQTLLPVVDGRDPSGASPVDWRGMNRLSIWSTDVSAWRAAWERGRNGVYLGIGLRFGQVRNLREESQAQTAYVYNGFSLHEDYLNRITITSGSTMNSTLMLGPSLGLKARGASGPFNFYVSAADAVLFGKAKHFALWHDVDDIHAVWSSADGTTTVGDCMAYLNGTFPLETRERMAVNVTDFELGAEVALGRHLALGVGGYLSRWGGVPIAVRWSVPGAWDALSGTGWRFERRDLTLGGLSANFSLKF